jgi:hypothetical protein
VSAFQSILRCHGVGNSVTFMGCDSRATLPQADYEM